MTYDQFVKPPCPITERFTTYGDVRFFFRVITPDFSFSGITAQALESITTILAGVKAHLRTLITPSTILLGHSLESNVRALQLFHPRRIDPRGRPLKPGLAWLTREWLGRTIQDRGPS